MPLGYDLISPNIFSGFAGTAIAVVNVPIIQLNSLVSE